MLKAIWELGWKAYECNPETESREEDYWAIQKDPVINMPPKVISRLSLFIIYDNLLHCIRDEKTFSYNQSKL